MIDSHHHLWKYSAADYGWISPQMTAIRRICSENGVACGHPHVDAGNAQKVLDEGYRFVMSAPGRTLTGLDACRKVSGRT